MPSACSQSQCFFLLNNVDKKNQEKKECLKNKRASSHPSFKVYMTRCVCLCECSHVCGCTYMCVWGSEVTFQCHSPGAAHLIFWNWSGNHQVGWLTGWRSQGFLTGMCYHAQFFFVLFFLNKSSGNLAWVGPVSFIDWAISLTIQFPSPLWDRSYYVTLASLEPCVDQVCP